MDVAGVAAVVVLLFVVLVALSPLLYCFASCLRALLRELRAVAREACALWSEDRRTRRAARQRFAALGRVSLVLASVAAVVYSLVHG